METSASGRKPRRSRKMGCILTKKRKELEYGKGQYYRTILTGGSGEDRVAGSPEKEQIADEPKSKMTRAQEMPERKKGV